jgi:hypothetical protein
MRTLCCWSFQQLGIGAGSGGTQQDIEVVDLLVVLARAASTSGRANIIFDPYPTIFDPDRPDKPVITPDRKVRSELPLFDPCYPLLLALSRFRFPSFPPPFLSYLFSKF